MAQHLTVTHATRAVEAESEGILRGVGVGKNVPTPTLTSILNIKQTLSLKCVISVLNITIITNIEFSLL
jgi:hypothetical protein